MIKSRSSSRSSPSIAYVAQRVKATSALTRDAQDNGQTKTSTVMRTYAHMQWLQSKLVENHRNEIVPVLPEVRSDNYWRLRSAHAALFCLAKAPTASSLQDKEYIEKKRRQFDRFVVRIASRPSFVGDADLRTFLTSAAVRMAPHRARPRLAHSA